MKRILQSLALLIVSCTLAQTGNNIRTLITSTIVPNQTQVAAPIIIETVPLDPNTLKFIFDAAGNQTNRQFVYIASGVWRPANINNPEPVAKEKTLTESDLFDDILYYPNPVISELFVKWKNSENSFVEKIELYSFSGQLLKSIPNNKNNEETTFDFQEFPSGYYNLVLVYSSGESKDLKIIKN